MATEPGNPTNSGRQYPISGGTPERLSPEVVRELYEAHSRELTGFLAGVLRDVDAAAEVVQTTFRRLLEAGHEARAESIKGWLFKVGFHEALAYRRRLARDSVALNKYPSRSERPMVFGVSADELANGGLNGLVLREDVGRLKELVGKLSPEQQHVLRERIYEEKTFAVIASELEVPLGTVLTRMRLAMEKLQKWMKEDSK